MDYEWYLALGSLVTWDFSISMCESTTSFTCCSWAWSVVTMTLCRHCFVRQHFVMSRERDGANMVLHFTVICAQHYEWWHLG